MLHSGVDSCLFRNGIMLVQDLICLYRNGIILVKEWNYACSGRELSLFRNGIMLVQEWIYVCSGVN